MTKQREWNSLFISQKRSSCSHLELVKDNHYRLYLVESIWFIFDCISVTSGLSSLLNTTLSNRPNIELFSISNLLQCSSETAFCLLPSLSVRAPELNCSHTVSISARHYTDYSILSSSGLLLCLFTWKQYLNLPRG